MLPRFCRTARPHTLLCLFPKKVCPTGTAAPPIADMARSMLGRGGRGPSPDTQRVSEVDLWPPLPFAGTFLLCHWGKAGPSQVFEWA